MKITALPKIGFDTLMRNKNITNENVEFTDYMLVSIVGTDNTEKHYFDNGLNNVLNLFFDDVEEDRERSLAFKSEQAQQVIDFINNNLNKTNCFVHCSAGVSRSGGIATFINFYLDLEDSAFRKNNPQILPNAQVIARLKQKVREIVNKFEIEYAAKHSRCPKCNSEYLNITEMYCVPDPKDLENFQDTNIATCNDCNHECTVHELI